MSLKPSPVQPVPAETVRVAHAAFPKGNPYLQLRDTLGTIFTDDDFADLYPTDGQPALPPWRLALVTILQFRENLSDRQAADAVRARIDWKYLLGLELTDAGFNFSVLSEFRSRLLQRNEERLLDRLLERCRTLDLLKERGQQRTDATRVLAAIRVLNRLELVAETLRAALNAVATVAPDWLRRVAPADWYVRYSRRIEDDRLPESKEQRTAYAQTVGEDAFALLAQIDAPDAPPVLHTLPYIAALRRMVTRHYTSVSDETGATPGYRVSFKADADLPPSAEGMESPYDLDARFRSRYALEWTGYLVHLTETCDAEDVHLITHVETTQATVHESQMTETIHQALVNKGLSPCEHIVDAAYVDAELLVDSDTQHDIDLVGPVRLNNSWQTKVEGAYDLDQFHIDWAQQQVRCPQGNLSVSWKEGVDNTGAPLIHVLFRRKDCRECPVRSLCTRAHSNARRLGFRPQAQFEAMQAARQRQDTPEGRQLYQRRAGIEGTISQGVRAFGLRRTRYRGLLKTHLQHIATAAAINLDRLVNWWNELPHAATRTSRFAQLKPS